MKTRFAPSPTGIMHIGNLRAALLSYLWAVKNDAELLLRIDDTDRERSKEVFEKYIYEDLEWLGIKWNSTFKQSDRFELYKEVMDKCIESGLVYDVYENEEELDALKKIAISNRLAPAYKKSENRIRKEKEDQYWRFDIGKLLVEFHDKIRGKIKIDLSTTSDPVIRKTNGDFTYIFASVVDDLDSGISTVIRASDHISNTCIQLGMIKKIQEANIFPKTEIEFAHYPLFTNKSKEKLSKRKRSMSVETLKESIHPLAVSHFLFAVGNNQKIKPAKDLSELAKSFSLKSYSSSNTVEFSENQLGNWQKRIICSMTAEEAFQWSGVKVDQEWDVIKDSVNNKEDILYWQEVFHEQKSFCTFLDIEMPEYPLSNDNNNKDKATKMLFLRQVLTGQNCGPRLDILFDSIPKDIINFRLSNYTTIISHFYNSTSKTKEKFTPIELPKVRMYACGPTLYDSPHIGNARSFVVFDVLYRMLKFQYKDIIYSRNITDIDDKIINRAQEMNLEPQKLVDMVYSDFEEQMNKLNVSKPTFEPRVTQFLPEIIAAIEKMISDEYAYIKDDGVYFRISKVTNYNLFSIIGESHSDFVLWKLRLPEETGWPSPWGWGRPGWHIECTAMSEKTLGLPFDIHCGGMDLIFPHHTNECAQSCGLGFQKTANYWLHNNFINIDDLKMSKSLDNFIKLNDIKQHPMIIRTTLLSSHYRQTLPWSENLVNESSVLYNKWRRLLGNSINKKPIGSGYPLKSFLEAMNNDMNTPLALKTLDASIGKEKPEDIIASFELIGIEFDFSYLKDRSIIDLVKKRISAKNEKNFEKADLIRKELEKMNVQTQESESEVFWYTPI